MHRVSFEIFAEITSDHAGLLASKLGKKASTNLGAIHSLPQVPVIHSAKVHKLFTESCANIHDGCFKIGQEKMRVRVAAV